ncbi:site-specific DNA-methyltransferase [Eubacteriales bacterium OttesenSCG-928-M02]|nr:site-specific DNA-methyltransferase [Eubacteriales bacterium OttesenSCG-928-M02]
MFGIEITKAVYKNENNMFLLGDITQGAKEGLSSYAGKVDMIYLDPPFYTNQKHIIRQRVGALGHLGNRQYLLDIPNEFDRFDTKEIFMDYMRQLLEVAHELLSPKGSIYIHVDYRASAMVRLLADEIFGEKNLLNEIIWHYKSGGRAKNFYSRKHDNIYFYKKRFRPYFNPEAVGSKRGEERRNNMKRNVDKDGKVYYSIRSAGKEYRYYADATIYPDDVWSDISHLQQKDPERTGYPTQKPVALLSRMIAASCPEGGLVCDLCCGSGTTAVAAALLGRRFLGMDKNPLSLLFTRRRMLLLDEGFASIGETEMQRPAQVDYSMTKGDGRSILLKDYRIDGYENPYKEGDKGLVSQVTLGNLDLIPSAMGDITLVDHASIGYVRDGVYHVKDVVVRSNKYPYIQDVLHMDLEQGIPTLAIADVYGNYSFHPLS